MQVQLATGQMVHVPVPQGYGPGMMVRAPYIIIIISVLFIALTCNLPSGVIKSNSQIYCCHGGVALSKAYNYYQRRALSAADRRRAAVKREVLKRVLNAESKRVGCGV